MAEWAPKRFWKIATVVACDGGWTVQLDGRSVKTPAKALLVVPTKAMADKIALEWDAQDEKIDPRTMPVTRGANAAIDKISQQRAEVLDLLAAYGDADLLCYRAAGPVELVARQAENWDPVLAWSATTLGAPLDVAEGVMHIAQPPESLARLTEQLATFDDFSLAAVHDLIAMSGSLVLALAVTKEYLSASEAWALSRVDENWQIEQWGADDEAAATDSIKHAAFLDAAAFYSMLVT